MNVQNNPIKQRLSGRFRSKGRHSCSLSNSYSFTFCGNKWAQTRKYLRLLFTEIKWTLFTCYICKNSCFLQPKWRDGILASVQRGIQRERERKGRERRRDETIPTRPSLAASVLWVSSSTIAVLTAFIFLPKTQLTQTQTTHKQPRICCQLCWI